MRRYRLVAGGVAALLVTVFAAVRVFLPGDTLDRIRGPFPPPVAVEGRVYGELMRAPLVVGTRMRVYGAQNRVWADGPMDMDAPASALWAFRRWPAQLVGVLADHRVVVSKWSDGQLVAIDADTGRIAWRADGGVGATAYAGRRTGASTVYEPPGLYLASGAPATVVSVQRSGELRAFDADTGKLLWHKAFSDRPDCRNMFTAPDTVLVVDRCAQPSTMDSYRAETGGHTDRVPAAPGMQPVGCAVGSQDCRGVAGPNGGFLIQPGGQLTPAPYLTGTGSWLVGLLVVHIADGHVVAHDALTGAPAWSWPSSGAVPDGTRIVATEPDLVHVITPDGNLFNLESATGLERSGYPANVINAHKPWVPGHVYAANGFVAIERLLPGGKPDGKDSQYYYPFPTVLLTGS